MSPTSELRILILGGYGVFGGRLVHLLESEPRLTLVVAGRSLAAAQRFCAGRKPRARLNPIAADRDGDLIALLREHRPDIVVDASGPFQAYDDATYRVAEACVAVGCHYLDLADGSAFVAGITGLDQSARARGVFVLSGVSSFPVLTAAVVRDLARGLTMVETIAGGIAPSPYAGVGRNVIQAIASYAGKPVQLTRDGKPAIGYGLTEGRRWTIAPPGRLPLRSTWFSLVDVPDLRVLPPLWPGLREVWMGAGPVPEVLHRGLNALAWLVRAGLVSGLTPLTGLFHTAINTVRWGEHRGGMIVEIEGRDDVGSVHRRSWHLLAEGEDGPLIPSMAIEAIVRHMLAGRVPHPGARAAVGELSLDDYRGVFAARTIDEGIRHEEPRQTTLPLYQQILGTAWHRLPAQLRDMHSPGHRMVARGRGSVERGRGWIANAIAAVFGFPAAARDVPVSVTFETTPEREVWSRDFAGTRFRSVQSRGVGREEYLVVERFGLFSVALALIIDGDRLRIVPRRWRILGIPLLGALMPRGDCHETVADGRFAFHVEIIVPLAGLVVRYRGSLEPDRDDQHLKV